MLLFKSKEYFSVFPLSGKRIHLRQIRDSKWSEDRGEKWLPSCVGRERQTDRGTERKRTKANKPWIFFPFRCNGKAR